MGVTPAGERPPLCSSGRKVILSAQLASWDPGVISEPAILVNWLDLGYTPTPRSAGQANSVGTIWDRVPTGEKDSFVYRRRKETVGLTN